MIDENIIDGEDLEDFFMAWRLLNGVVETIENTRPKTIFFENSIADEKRARKSLVKLLRSPKPFPRQLRIFLANLFDDSDDNQNYRKIKIENYAGNSSDQGGDVAIAKIIYYQHIELQKPIGKVIQMMTEIMPLSKQQIENIWYKQRNGLLGWNGKPLPKKRSKRVPLSNN